jgi:hypothetical protein
MGHSGECRYPTELVETRLKVRLAMMLLAAEELTPNQVTEYSPLQPPRTIRCLAAALVLGEGNLEKGLGILDECLDAARQKTA